MNVRQIEVFKAVMETGSVTGASERLRISQPSASKHLKALERAVGVTLFERTGNRLLATDEASAFYSQVERTFQGLDHLARFAAGLKHHPSGEIAVASMPMLARRWLPEILAPFLSGRSGVSLALPIRSSSWIAEAVAAGQVDLGLGLAVAEAGGLDQEPLMRMPLVCVMPPDQPLAGLGVVGPADLSAHTLITLSNFDQWRLAIEMALEGSGVEPRRRVDTFTTQVACELVVRGVGVAIVDALTALDYEQRGLVWRRFTPATAFEIVVMRSRRRQRSRLAEDLVTMLHEAAGRTRSTLRAVGLVELLEQPA
ncbi:MAG: LysR family transcriptional regulator [Rhizobiales bacterium]|nr:LysR family transcriptional regulator [Hyphomicrobiales bacterium]